MRTVPARSAQRGSAMIIVTTFTVVIIGVTASILGVMVARSKASVERIRLDHTQRASEAALTMACGWVNSLAAVPANLAGTIQGGEAVGLPWSATIRRNAAKTKLFKVSVASGDASGFRT